MERRISILNKINHKSLIMEAIFPFSYSRSILLYDLISNDKCLKNKLKKIFTNVYRKKNKLGAEFDTNIEIYSIINKLFDILSLKLDKIKSKFLKYDYLSSELNYSVINYLYKSLLEYVKANYYNNMRNIIMKIIKRMTMDFYSRLNEVSLSLLPNENYYLDLEYLNYIEELNRYSKPKNKIIQKIKIIFLFDDNEFYNINNYIVKYPNIYAIEIIFKDHKINKGSLFNNFCLYLDSIEHLENINKIIFHNIITDNNYDKNNKEVNNDDLYQSLLSYLFDDCYLAGQNYYQIKLMQNIKEIIIEDITFLYLYEKIKLYFFLIDLFPTFSSFSHKMNNPNNIQYSINDKILIIFNKDIPINIKDIFSFIKSILVINKNIKYLLIVNHNILTKDENETLKDNIDIDIKFQNLKEFMYISKLPDNNNELIEKLSFYVDDNNYNIYEGYNDENKLLYFRKGVNFIKSSDLIDIFKFNKNITSVRLKNEQININFNKERTHLEIKNFNPIKDELNNIINSNLNIKHFTKFIYNQSNLVELSINKFDYNFKDLINNNIKILNINYEKTSTIFKYNLIDKNSKSQISNFFPNLTNLNISSNENWILDLRVSDFPNTFTSMKIFVKYPEKKKMAKLQQKFKKYKKTIIFESIENNSINNENEYEDIGDEESEDEYDYDEFDEIVNNYKPKLYSKNAIGEIKGKGKYQEKYDTSHTMTPSRIINEKKRIYSQTISSNFSIFDYSKIMQEYKNITKEQKKLYYFSLHWRTKNIKLKYRASDNKKVDINQLFKFEQLISKGDYVFIMKILDDIYFYMDALDSPDSDLYRKIFFMTSGQILVIFSNQNLKILMGSKIQLKDCFSLLKDQKNEGILDTDLVFKNRTIPKTSAFFINDVEIFELTIPPWKW